MQKIERVYPFQPGEAIYHVSFDGPRTQPGTIVATGVVTRVSGVNDRHAHVRCVQSCALMGCGAP
jgi:hypothetical protein